MWSCEKENQLDNSLLDNSLKVVNESDYRPAFHFTPPSNWMNDPNGLVYYQGEYHLFYQYNPHGNTWGPMNWGHAVSTDLYNWKDLSIALSPDVNGTIFSGSVVIDSANLAGFRTGNELPMVAIYTNAGVRQTQSIAFSNDKGRNWIKYENNPVLSNPAINDFRDPKVIWYSPEEKWVMSLATGNKICFYSSKDFKSWKFESDFGLGLGAHGGVWECPDLFQLTVEGTNTKKWVLLVSLNPGGPNGGSATQYFVGEFDGKTFTTEDTEIAWADYGTDNYAGVTYSNVPASDGRRIMIGWMSNWNYAGSVPTLTWRSTMTVPRVITLIENESKFKLRFNPAVELNKYKNKKNEINISLSKEINLSNNDIVKSGCFDINFNADMTTADNLTISFGNILEKLDIYFDKKSGIVTIDRSKSGQTAFSVFFKNNILCNSLQLRNSQDLNIRILIDKTSLELFWNNGENVMTALFFPVYQYDFVKISGNTSTDFIKGFNLSGFSKSIVR